MFCIYTQTDLITFIEHMYVLRIKKKKDWWQRKLPAVKRKKTRRIDTRDKLAIFLFLLLPLSLNKNF